MESETERQAEHPHVGRPRSAQAHEAILRATLELLAEDGLEGLRIEAVAERAGVGKTTIYRRWASKNELTIEAITSLGTNEALMVDTGNIRDDLLLLFAAVQRLSRESLLGRIMRRMLGEVAQQSPIFDAFCHTLIAPRVNQMAQMIARARTRGEVRQDIPVQDIVEMIDGLLVYHMMATGIFLADEQHLPQRVDLILQGIAAHGSHPEA